MVTSGGAISGYCSIDSTDTDTAPASTIRTDTTDERMGRSMKKCVNIELLFCRLDDLHRLARNHLQHAVDHHPLAGLEAVDDDDVLVALVVAHRDRPQLGEAVGLDHVHQMPLGSLLHRE